jgi:hypothetical protein
MDLDQVGMMIEVEARRLLTDLPITLSILAPPYPALGCGKLRVLRVRESGGRYDVVAGYEAYEKLAP